MTKRRRTGKVTEDGLFVFYNREGIPILRRTMPLGKKMDILDDDFIPRTVFDIDDEFLQKYMKGTDPGDLELSFFIYFKNN